MNGCPSQLNNFVLLWKFEGTFTTQWWVGVIVFPACQKKGRKYRNMGDENVMFATIEQIFAPNIMIYMVN